MQRVARRRRCYPAFISFYGAITPDGKRVVTAHGMLTAGILDIVTGKPIALLKGRAKVDLVDPYLQAVCLGLLTLLQAAGETESSVAVDPRVGEEQDVGCACR